MCPVIHFWFLIIMLLNVFILDQLTIALHSRIQFFINFLCYSYIFLHFLNHFALYVVLFHKAVHFIWNSYDFLFHQFPEEVLLIISLLFHALEFRILRSENSNLIIQLSSQEIFLLPCLVHFLRINFHLIHCILLSLIIISVTMFFLRMTITFTMHSYSSKLSCITPNKIISFRISSWYFTIIFIRYIWW